MCCPDCNGDRPPANPPAPNPPTPVNACPANVTCVIRAADGTSVPCAVVPVGGTIQLRAVPSCGSGTYQWTTTSANITLSNTTSQTVTVTALNTVSTGRGAETVQLVFTPPSGTALAPVTQGVTVIRVTFSASTTQRYGYDDMGNAAGVPHHVSVKRSDNTTVHVEVQGGGTGDDLEFTSDDASIATPVAPAAGTGASFELTINGMGQDRAHTNIKARCRCNSGPVCATIVANVYKEKVVSATVAKVQDSHSTGTTLAHPNFDVGGAAATQINGTYKDAVARITLTDASSTGGALDVRFDLDNNGRLTFEIDGTGREIDAINAAFTASGQRVVIVKSMLAIAYLEATARARATTITIKSSYGDSLRYITNGTYALGPGTADENVTITGRRGNVFDLSGPLAHDHGTTHGLLLPWDGLGGNPVLVQEAASEDYQRWVLGHELGHRLLGYADLDDTDNLMFHSAPWTDHRLRFRDESWHYPPGGPDHQWEDLSR